MCPHLQGSSVTLELPFFPLAPVALCDPQQDVLSPALALPWAVVGRDVVGFHH